MDERTVLRPGDYLTDDDRRILLFLVGPIFGAPAWQDMARTAIHDLRSDIVVVNPCLAEPNGNLGFEDQLAWERHYRRVTGDPRFGATLVWLPRQATDFPEHDYAQTSRYEVGELAAWHQHQGSRASLGIEPGFRGERFIRHCWRLECPGVKVSDSLQETCEEAVRVASRARA